MTKTELYEFFNQKISKTAFVLDNDEYMLVGKFCKIAVYENGLIDIWICNTKDLTKGLGTGKVNNIIAGLNLPVGTPVTVLNGEAYTKVRDFNIVVTAARVLGIRKKRVLTPEQLAEMTERMTEMRKKQLAS